MTVIKKSSVIISSIGRTGTKFLTFFFKNNFKNISAWHEPGKIEISNTNPKKILKSWKTFGFINLGSKNIRNISNKRLSDKISIDIAGNKIVALRKKFIAKTKQDLYLESSYHFYGLLDVLPLIFKKIKIIFIVRDPRDWVRSCLNKKFLYHKTDIHILFKNRPTPDMVKDKKYSDQWKKWNQFEKLCWAWNYINNYAIKSIKNNPNAKLCFFEDLFVSKNKYENLYELVNFVTDFDNIKKPKNLEIIIKKALEKKINKPNNYKFPQWRDWQPEQARKLDEICGKLMNEFGYGKELEWKKLIRI